MDTYDIRIKKDAERDLRNIPKTDIQRITKKIQTLTINPRPSGCEKLQGEEGYRIRQGDYRVIYLVDDQKKIVRILKVGHRREVYR